MNDKSFLVKLHEKYKNEEFPYNCFVYLLMIVGLFILSIYNIVVFVLLNIDMITDLNISFNVFKNNEIYVINLLHIKSNILDFNLYTIELLLNTFLFLLLFIHLYVKRIWKIKYHLNVDNLDDDNKFFIFIIFVATLCSIYNFIISDKINNAINNSLKQCIVSDKYDEDIISKLSVNNKLKLIKQCIIDKSGNINYTVIFDEKDNKLKVLDKIEFSSSEEQIYNELSKNLKSIEE